MDEPTGCEHCSPASAEAAWEARAQLGHVAELVDESHYHVMVLACGACGQRFLSVFTETIDWQDGDDPQYWKLLALTPAESDALVRAGGSAGESAPEAVGGGRRCLCVDNPKGGPKTIYWTKGLSVGFHD